MAWQYGGVTLLVPTRQRGANLQQFDCLVRHGRCERVRNASDSRCPWSQDQEEEAAGRPGDGAAGGVTPPRLMSIAIQAHIGEQGGSDRSIMSPVSLVTVGSKGGDSARGWTTELASAVSRIEGSPVGVDSPLLARMPRSRSSLRASTFKFPEIELNSQRSSHAVSAADQFCDDAADRDDDSDKEQGRQRVRQRRLANIGALGAVDGPVVERDSGQPVSVLTTKTDMVLEVFVYLDERELLVAMCVCRRWRELAGATHIWQEKGEVVAREGTVNWPAFKNLGMIREKHNSMVCIRAANFVLRIASRGCIDSPPAQEPPGPHVLHPDPSFPI